MNALAPNVAAPPGEMQPSPHQEAILAAVRETEDNLIIQAAAGSGKTTTLKLVCNELPAEKRVLAVCFNKAIALEFQRKLPMHVEAKTLHSVGFAICRGAQGRVKVDDYKVRRVLDDYGKKNLHFKEKQKFTAWRIGMDKLISVTYATRLDPKNLDALNDLCNQFNIDLQRSQLEDVAPIVRILRRDQNTVTFDDMLDHPLHHGYSFPEYDVVMVDEAQDLNAQQLEFVERLANGNGRVIAVGDRNQAIYGFRGADHAAMDRLQQRFNCRELPLSVCYRCGESIIREAQAVVGVEAIQSAENAPQGIVERLEPSNYGSTVNKLEPGDMVLCRVNKGLVSPCFNLIRRGVKAVIRGRDIGKGLATLVCKHERDAADLAGLLKAVDAWRHKHTARLLAQNRAAAAQAADDQVDTLFAIAENVETVEELLEAIGQIFSDDAEGVIFSSIHRAKGLEADCVVILGPELIPHPMAKTDAALQQEQNLNYVARTRARLALIYQPIPKEKK